MTNKVAVAKVIKSLRAKGLLNERAYKRYMQKKRLSEDYESPAKPTGSSLYMISQVYDRDSDNNPIFEEVNFPAYAKELKRYIDNRVSQVRHGRTPEAREDNPTSRLLKHLCPDWDYLKADRQLELHEFVNVIIDLYIGGVDSVLDVELDDNTDARDFGDEVFKVIGGDYYLVWDNCTFIM